MAVSIVTVYQGIDTHVADVIATADGDTTATIDHGLVEPGQEQSKPGRGGQSAAGIVPVEVHITPLIQSVAGLAEWAATTIGSLSVILTKSTAVGSSDAAEQIRCIIKRPNSYGR